LRVFKKIKKQTVCPISKRGRGLSGIPILRNELPIRLGPEGMKEDLRKNLGMKRRMKKKGGSPYA
jgi:hypothetical protein